MVCTLMVWGASSASAGGPTSVLITSPAAGEASALYYSDADYRELERLLGPAETGSTEQPKRPDLDRARQINVTWLAHDISPWRIDRVFAVESEPPWVWIHTAANVPENLNGYWHRAEQPGRLSSLLKRLGVTGKASGEGYTGIFPAPWQSDAADAPDAAETPGPATTDTRTGSVRAGAPGAGDRTDDGTDWWWALPGMAAGAVLALLLRPFALQVRPDRWRRKDSAGPRQELRDI